MIRQDRAFDLLIKILEEVDEAEYPEMYAAVEEAIIPEGGIIMVPLYDITKRIMEADSAKVMPPEVADFMAEALVGEINGGNYCAATDLGALYYTGRIGVQNFAEAVRYYKIAAEHNEPQAIENLGYCYYYGRSVEQDYEKAYHYFSLGGYLGKIRSLYKIGDMFKNGYYVEKNEAEAFRIYERCLKTLDGEEADDTIADVMFRMGECLYKGIGIEKDYESAMNFMQSAEVGFYVRIKTGEVMLKGNYEKAIRMQEEIRKIMQEEL